jgi:prepilin-type N-terminal cleavage/methylation domain-containing protein
MRKGFTLLELIVVMIIVGILATLGIYQYQSVIEKSRGTEARQVIGVLRSACAGIWLQNGTTVACTAGNLGLSTSATIEQGRIPSTTCWGTNFFRYTISTAGAANAITFQGNRCEGVAGKQPGAPASSARTLNLAIDYGSGSDVWTSNAGY